MKTFILEGKIVFEAKDIDDAFKKLSTHFKALASDADGIELLPETDINLGIKE